MRWLLIAIAVVVLVLAGLWSVNHYIRKDDFSVVRNALEQRVAMVSGKQFRIHGPVSMTTSLVPTVQFEDLRLENAEWAQDDYLFAADSFVVRLRLIPLIFGDYSIGFAKFSGVDINLEMRADGTSNFQLEIAEDDDDADFDAVFNNLNFENLNLRVLDHRSNSDTVVVLDSFSASTDSNRDPIEIDVRGTFNGVPAQIAGHVGSYSELMDGTGSDLDLKLEYRNLQIRASGRIDGPEPNGFRPGDIHVIATGTDIMEFADFHDFEFINTDQFSVDWHMLGTLEDMQARNADIYLEANGNTLSIKGDHIDLVDLATFDVDVELSGSNMNQQYGQFSDIAWPESDSYKGNGKISRANGITTLSNMLVEATEGPARITIGGSIANVEELLGFDLDYQISGNNVEILESFSGIDLPPTDQFMLSGHLQGAGAGLRADDLEFEVIVDELTVKAHGSIANIVEGTGFDLDSSAQGNDLGDIDTLLLPFTEFSLRDSILQNPDLDEAVTGSFVIKGKLTGSGDSLQLTGVDGKADRNNIDITLAGSVGDLFGLENVDLRFTATGPDVSGLNVVLPTELPRTGRYEASGRLLGTIPKIAITEFVGEMDLNDHQLVFRGNLGSLDDFDGQNLQITLAGDNIRDLEAFVDMRFPPSQRYRASARTVGTGGRLDLRDIVFDGFRDSLNFKVRGNVNDFRGVPQFDFGVEFEGKEFGEGGAYFDTQWPREGPFRFGGTIEGNANEVIIKEVHGTVGQSHIRGRATIKPGERLAITDAYISGQFDATPWLPEPEELQEKRAQRGKLFSERQFNLSALRDIDIDLHVDELSLTDNAALITIRNGHVQLKDGVLLAEPFDAQYQQAVVDTRIEIDARTDTPKVSLEFLSEGFNLGMYLDQADLKERIEGIVDFSIQATGDGSSVAQLASTSTGETYFLFTHGFFPKQDLPLKITDFIFASFKWLGEKRDLEVDCAMSYASVEAGIMKQEVLWVDSNQMNMAGFGEVNLQNESYRLTVAPRPKRRRFLSTDLDVDIRGTLLDPEFSLNTASAARSGVKHYGAFLALGPAGFLVPTSMRGRGVPCAPSIAEFKNYIATERSE